MKILNLALNTFQGLVHNRIIVLFLAIFLGLLLLLLAPLTAMRHHATVVGTGALTFIEILVSLLSAFGTLLSVWASADAIGVEIRSGTVLAVLARPLHRWEFLLGKFFGVQLLMACYIAFMMTFTYAASLLGGVTVQAPWWVLIAYPLTGTRFTVHSPRCSRQGCVRFSLWLA
jgi:ABC-type transport system involved in multi-copper enzyme maturation permease subunit